MSTNPTNEHREQDNELLPCPLCGSTNLKLRDIAGWELDCANCELSLVLAEDPSREGLIARWNNRALLSRDAEIREVLEGLASKVYVSFKGQYCWCRLAGLATRPEGDSHDLHCQRTRELVAKLQPKEASDGTE